jgi:hypothetical protein
MHSAAFWRRAVFWLGGFWDLFVRLGGDSVGVGVLDAVDLRVRVMAFTNTSCLHYTLHGLVSLARQLSLIVCALPFVAIDYSQSSPSNVVYLVPCQRRQDVS